MARKNTIALVMLALVAANALAWLAVFELAKPQRLQATFFDVGQGDAIFIETPQRHQILIDGGPTSAVLEKLGREMPFWDRTIDLVILTHPERDHITGLLGVLKRYRVENILWTGVMRTTPEYNEWRALLEKEKAEGAAVFLAPPSKKILCANCSGSAWYIEILWPEERITGRELKKSNDSSIVARLVFGTKTFLFTGDIEEKTEKALLSSGLQLDSDVLKVAHHGSKNSSSKPFIEAVAPNIAVISAGKDNRYGHPHKQTLETIEMAGAKIIRTDEIGTIVLISDGSTIEEK